MLSFRSPRSEKLSMHVSGKIKPIVIFSFITILLIFASISNQSLWIDEGVTASYAMQENFSSFIGKLLTEDRSEAQLPLGMFLAFGFGKLLGYSEYALRIPNLLWMGLAVIAFAGIGFKLRIPWLPLLLAIHPMVWSYADEARPYALQIGLASLLLLSTVLMLFDNGQRISTRTLCLWWASGFLLCLSSLVASVIFAIWTVVFIIFKWNSLKNLTRNQLVISYISLSALTLLAIYYLWTFWRGAGGAKLWNVNIANVFFVLFEFGGFMGFTPGRAILREAARTNVVSAIYALKPFIFPILSLITAYVILVSFAARRYRSIIYNNILKFLILLATSCFLLILMLCFTISFPFWGRHFLPLLPVILVSLAMLLYYLPAIIRKPLLILVFVLLLTSSLLQRFTPQHRNDDYRNAVKLAMGYEDNQKTVLWMADLDVADYYRYQPKFHYLNIQSAHILNLADVVIISKPDIFDHHNQLNSITELFNLKPTNLVAFSVWERNDS